MAEKTNRPLSEETRQKIDREIRAYYGATNEPELTPEEEKRLKTSCLEFAKFMEQKQKEKRKATEK